MSLNMIVDTIFVGVWIGPLAIAAITVVMPITFLIASIGMAIGVGGGSMISRALGAGNREHAHHTFGNQIFMALVLVVVFAIVGIFFMDFILKLFGAKGNVFDPSAEYFIWVLPSIPFLAWCMLSNNVIRAEGNAKAAMGIMLISAISNIILDPIFIKVLDLGIAGAAMATAISYVLAALYALWYFVLGPSELVVKLKHLRLKRTIVREINALGVVTLARQGVASILAIALNNILIQYGGEIYLAVWGVINRMMMFTHFPIFGLTQGMLPIIGYNYGAKQYRRVIETLNKAMLYGTVIAGFIYLLLYTFRHEIVSVFGDDPQVLSLTPPALILVFIGTPIMAIQLMGAAYFQAIGKAIPALLLTLTRQAFFLIPFILIFPYYWGIDGVWWAFPASDVISTTVTYIAVKIELGRLGKVNGD